MAARFRPPIGGVVAVVGLIVALLAARVTDRTATSPIFPPEGAWRWAWVLGIATSFVAYLSTVRRVRRRPAALTPVLGIAIVMQLAPLAGPLLLSRDVYAYWTYGREAAIHHKNPYSVVPARISDDPAVRMLGDQLAGQTTIYGPGFTAASEIQARLTGASLRKAEVFYRVAAAIGVIALLLVVAYGLPSSTPAVAFIGLNPLFALHFAGGGHNDIWMLVLAVAGVLLARHKRQRLGGLAYSASATVKASALLLIPLEAAAACRRDARLGARFIIWFTCGAALLAGLATLHYGTAWTSSFARASTQLQHTSSLSAVYRLEQLGMSRAAAKVDLYALLLAGYLYLLWEAFRDGQARLGLAASLLIFTPAWLVPWYGSWPVAFSAIEDDLLAQKVAVAATGYLLLDAIPRSQLLPF